MFGEVAVERAERLRDRARSAISARDLVRRRPDVAQVDRLAVVPCAERLGRQVDVSTVPASAKATTSGGDIRKFALRFGWMRASKLRLPESTAAQTRSLLVDRVVRSRVERSPELPMQVVQP